jgi:hypothetical protein
MNTETLIRPPGTGPKSPRLDKLPQEQTISIASPTGLTSVLIPCCGQLEYTKLCVPSLLKHSRQPFELVFLDIGSLDGTAEYLATRATLSACLSSDSLLLHAAFITSKKVRLQRVGG